MKKHFTIPSEKGIFNNERHLYKVYGCTAHLGACCQFCPVSSKLSWIQRVSQSHRTAVFYLRVERLVQRSRSRLKCSPLENINMNTWIIGTVTDAARPVRARVFRGSLGRDIGSITPASLSVLL